MNIFRLWKPESFQGSKRIKEYFEGWYIKCVDKENKRSIALIPGISIDKDGNKTAFIQYIDSRFKDAKYITFPYESFKWSKNQFEISIVDNKLSDE